MTNRNNPHAWVGRERGYDARLRFVNNPKQGLTKKAEQPPREKNVEQGAPNTNNTLTL